MAYYRKPLQRREVTIIRRMKKVLKMPVTQIAIAVERRKSSIYKALVPAWRETPRGRPQKLTKKDITNLVKELRAMQRQARARREITLAMLKKRARCKACGKVIRKALCARGIRFRRMRSKPILTKDDVKVRYAFAKKWRHKWRKWWVKKIFSIDLKNFPCYVHAQARDVAAMHEVRGAYREAGQGLDECFVVVPKHLRYNPGVKSAKVAAGVGGGRVRMWRVLGKKWSGGQPPISTRGQSSRHCNAWAGSASSRFSKTMTRQDSSRMQESARNAKRGSRSSKFLSGVPT